MRCTTQALSRHQDVKSPVTHAEQQEGNRTSKGKKYSSASISGCRPLVIYLHKQRRVYIMQGVKTSLAFKKLFHKSPVPYTADRYFK